MAVWVCALCAAAVFILAAVRYASTVDPGVEPPLVSLASPRLVILKAKRTLHLFDGARLVRSYPIDLGSQPVGQKRLKADGHTPEGKFKVVTKNEGSEYHRFIGINYPNEGAADWGEERGLISAGAAASIRSAAEEAKCPEWDTPLGGGIGVHGHRKGKDWTGGCVAVSDSHIEELFRVLRIGDPVEILP